MRAENIDQDIGKTIFFCAITKKFNNLNLIIMNKAKKINLTLLIISVAIIFAAAFWFSRKESASAEDKTVKPLSVTVQSVAGSASLVQKIQYPAVTAGDQEVNLTAQTSGTITKLNFDLGSKVYQNMQLAKIDSIGNFGGFGENNLQNSSIQALEMGVKSAEESYKIAKDKYKEDDSYANKKGKSIAKISLEMAEANLAGALDTRLAVSPISGTIIERFVSQGDSVAVGQKLATISKTGLTKVKFFVDKEELSNLKAGMPIVINEDGNEISGTISRISPQADPTTRRFLVEAKPTGKTPLVLGSVINVSIEITKNPISGGNIILPLSAISIGQNESYIFIAENNKSKKINIEITKVIGEYAEIKVTLPSDAQIIIDGSKLVKNEDAITIDNK